MILVCALLSISGCTAQRQIQQNQALGQWLNRENQPLQIEVVTNGLGRLALQMKYTFYGSNTVRVLPEILPWYPRCMKFYAGFPTNEYWSVIAPFWNFSGDMNFDNDVILKPHDCRTNLVELEEILPGIEGALRTNDLVLFWIYAPPERENLVRFPPARAITVRKKAK